MAAALKAAKVLPNQLDLVGALVRPGRTAEMGKHFPDLAIVESLDALRALSPDIVVEAAGQGAVTAYGEALLLAGIDLIVVSVGALAEPGLFERLQAAAREGCARIVLPAGAVGGIDALSAMRLGGLRDLRYRGIKPPLAWRGSPAESQVDLDRLDRRTVLFEGSARAAALAFPQNANVAATIALAGLGFDATRVELVADPAARHNLHEIEAEGVTGKLHLRIEGLASSSNPKTSALTALSVARALVNEGAGIVL
jgi:aspartate dehydrogenase